MRRALLSFIMAATVMTPIAAEARPDRNDSGRAERSHRAERPAPQRNTARPAPQRNVARPQVQRQGPQARVSRPMPAPEARTPRATPAAYVQRDGRRGDRNRGERGNRGDRGTTPSGYQRGWQGPNTPENRRDADRYNRRAQENAIRYGTPAQRRDAVRDARRDGRDWRGDRNDRRDWRGDRNDRRGWNRGDRNWRNDWNHGWRNDRRYDWRGWRNNHRNVFRGSRYYAPYRGWNYRRFSIGIFLEPLFYGQNYWIGDPWQYRLPPAPYGTEWVRYYNDVMLVDIYTGEVVDVIYDFFW